MCLNFAYNAVYGIVWLINTRKKLIQTSTKSLLTCEGLKIINKHFSFVYFTKCEYNEYDAKGELR